MLVALIFALVGGMRLHVWLDDADIVFEHLLSRKEVGINPAIARSLRLKLWIMSGMSGPRILVIKEMVNQNAIISVSIPKFFFII